MKPLIFFFMILLTSCSLGSLPIPMESDIPLEESVDATQDSSSIDSESSTSSSSNTSSSEYPAAATSSSDTPEEEFVETPVEPFNWARVLITEVVTDPQQDHGESGEGNGIPFDAEPGSGTVGSSDEYVEIYNGTDATVDLTGWSLTMSDGTDEVLSFSDSSFDSYFSAGGDVTNFSSGEFMVIGNPDGSLNNEIALELFNDLGETVDSVNVDDANASDVSDEAYFRDVDGVWGQGEATPGVF